MTTHDGPVRLQRQKSGRLALVTERGTVLRTFKDADEAFAHREAVLERLRKGAKP